jgi:hypothetical protein
MGEGGEGGGLGRGKGGKRWGIKTNLLNTIVLLLNAKATTFLCFFQQSQYLKKDPCRLAINYGARLWKNIGGFKSF